LLTYDWSKFTTRININADIKTAYDAWTSRSALERWFLRTAEFTTLGDLVRGNQEIVAKGDRYRWLWHGYDDSVVEKGTILDANGEDLIMFSFAGTCVVTVTLKKELDETIVELEQQNIPVDETARVNYHLGCMTGWTFYLANLKSILEGGLDLRNKNEKIQKVINA
jgi:uncharacterized protein YndB with AHSA1/START domain